MSSAESTFSEENISVEKKNRSTVVVLRNDNKLKTNNNPSIIPWLFSAWATLLYWHKEKLWLKLLRGFSILFHWIMLCKFSSQDIDMQRYCSIITFGVTQNQAVISLLSPGFTISYVSKSLLLMLVYLQNGALSFRRHQKYLEMEQNSSNSEISHLWEGGTGKIFLRLLSVCVRNNQTVPKSNTKSTFKQALWNQ